MTALTDAEKRAIKKEKLSKRITELDVLRGIAVVLMVFDHFMYDIFGVMPGIVGGYTAGGFWANLCTLASQWWNWPVRKYVRQLVLFIFLALTGISCSFSRSNLKRGVKLMIFSLLLTGATVAVDLIGGMGGYMTIVFGILHLIALCLLIISLIEKLTDSKWVYLAVGATLVIVGLCIANPMQIHEYPVNYDGTFGEFLSMFGEAFIGKILLGPDSYSFLYYGGQVFIGVFLGKLLYPERKPLLFKNGYSNNPLTFAGRHTLIVYVAHQVLIPVILGLILLMCGYEINL